MTTARESHTVYTRMRYRANLMRLVAAISIWGTGTVWLLAESMPDFRDARLIAHYKFDGNLNDETGQWPGTPIGQIALARGLPSVARRFCRMGMARWTS